MDDEKQQLALRKLNWEAHHWKRSKGRDTGRAFLAEIEYLDPDFDQALRNRGITTGTLLDIGTGTGRQAIEFARLGFTVTATDISRIGIAYAVGSGIAAGVTIRFLEDDITHTTLTDTFDVVADRGCYTVLQNDFMAEYATSVARLVRPDGIFLLKVDRKRADQIEYLRERFTVVETCESSYPIESKTIKATFFVLQPKASTS